MGQTIFYPGTQTPQLVIQDDGSIYHYAPDGKKTVAFEQYRTAFYNTDEELIGEIQADTNNSLQITFGTSAAKVYISQQDGTVEITGALKINGVEFQP